MVESIEVIWMKKIIDLIIGIVLVAYFITVNTVTQRRISFSEAFLVLGIILIIYHFVKKKLEENIIYRNIIRSFKILSAIVLVVFIVAEVAIVAFPKSNTDNTDYIVILGAGLRDGNQPSTTLTDRMNAALECINEYGNDGFIVLSGGQGSDETISEAEAMRRYLVEGKGIPEEKIIIEDKSTSTYENFEFSKGKIEEHSGKSIDKVSVKCVTTDFHALRSSILSKKIGYKDVKFYTSSTLWYLVPSFYFREAFALGKSIVFGN